MNPTEAPMTTSVPVRLATSPWLSNLVLALRARIWKKPRFAGIVKHYEPGQAGFHEEELPKSHNGVIGSWVQNELYFLRQAESFNAARRSRF